MKNILIIGCLLCFSSAVMAEVVGKQVEYQSDGTTFKGYLAFDDALEGQRPGVLVVHEWWGHNDYARKRAEMLAAEGYTALAVDMYGEGKQASHPEDAGRFAGEVKKNMDLATKRFLAADSFLKSHASVQPTDISAIGYCFGGGIVLEMARRGVDLDLVASFHGSLGTEQPAKANTVKARVLVYNGADDPFVKAEQIDAFKAEMSLAKVDFSFVDYPGAKHSFTNPAADQFGKQFNLPLAYDKQADEKSWQSLLKALSSVYKN
ncbi:MAG: dienelactone hydrolase family protein [Gammaproteobacteria bacterium]|nr:dienelactone hydrolase family protein [Gammaproteobacteria bacterium]